MAAWGIYDCYGRLLDIGFSFLRLLLTGAFALPIPPSESSSSSLAPNRLFFFGWALTGALTGATGLGLGLMGASSESSSSEPNILLFGLAGATGFVATGYAFFVIGASSESLDMTSCFFGFAGATGAYGLACGTKVSSSAGSSSLSKNVAMFFEAAVGFLVTIKSSSSELDPNGLLSFFFAFYVTPPPLVPCKIDAFCSLAGLVILFKKASSSLSSSNMPLVLLGLSAVGSSSSSAPASNNGVAPPNIIAVRSLFGGAAF